MSDSFEVRDLVDALFILTDQKAWREVRALFVDGAITLDMSSLVGGGPVQITADQLVAGFTSGLHAGKLSHHMATNYRIVVNGPRAEAWAHGYAWNRVLTLPPGEDFWETWGNYRITCRRVKGQWRINGFHYFSKHTRGPDGVRTHTA